MQFTVVPTPTEPTRAPAAALLDRRYPDFRRNRLARGIDDTVKETFSRRDIYDRDHWRCQRCGDPVKENPGPAELAASVDYRDANGPHTRDNVQLAHRGCNDLHHTYDQAYRDLRGNREQRGLDTQPRERFTVNDVGRRDEWVCQLCRQSVSPQPVRPVDSVLAASLDHIDEEGPHTRDNVQLTHVCCNNFRDHIRFSVWAGVEFTAQDYRAVVAWRTARRGQPFPMRRWPEVLRHLVVTDVAQGRLDPQWQDASRAGARAERVADVESPSYRC